MTTSCDFRWGANPPDDAETPPQVSSSGRPRGRPAGPQAPGLGLKALLFRAQKAPSSSVGSPPRWGHSPACPEAGGLLGLRNEKGVGITCVGWHKDAFLPHRLTIMKK